MKEKREDTKSKARGLPEEKGERNEKIDTKDSRQKKGKIIFVSGEEIAGSVEKKC